MKTLVATRPRLAAVMSTVMGTLLAWGCGKTTPLGNVVPSPDGGGATSGEGGTGGEGGGSASGGAAGASGGSGASGASGANPAGGASGSGTAGFPATDAGPTCHLPEPTPNPNPTPEELTRAQLIRDYCATLIRDNCLYMVGGSSFIQWQTRGCSTEEQATACELDRQYEYVQFITPACDDEWQAAIRCMAAQTFASCESPGLFDQPAVLCSAEKGVLAECHGKNPTWTKVTGLRGTCDYGMGTFGTCEVSCPIGNHHFGSQCGGPAGLPIRCGCIIDGIPAGDLDYELTTFYAGDCGAAAQRIADGEWCTNRLDCCLMYVEDGEEYCECGSSPGCEAFAESRGATRVESCPTFSPPGSRR